MVAKISLMNPYFGVENHLLFDAIVWGEGKLAVGLKVNGTLVSYGHIDVTKRKFGTYFFHLPKEGQFGLKVGDIATAQVVAGYFKSTESREVEWKFESRRTTFQVS